MNTPTHPAHIPWTVQSEREIFARPPFFHVVEQTIVTGRGEVIEDFYQVRLRSFGLVVPILENGNVLLIQQYKHGPGSVCVGFPAGFLDPEEAPDQGAAREMREETGLVARALTPLGRFVDNGNQRGCEGHYFLGTGCHAVAAPDSGDLEDFEYLEMTPDDVDGAVWEGRFAVIHHAAAWGLARLKLGADAG